MHGLAPESNNAFVLLPSMLTKHSFCHGRSREELDLFKRLRVKVRPTTQLVVQGYVKAYC